MMTIVTLIIANTTPTTIIPIVDLLEELLTGIEDEVAEVDTTMSVVVKCVSNILEAVEGVVITVVVVLVVVVIAVVVVVVAMMVVVEVVGETAMIGFHSLPLQ